MLCNSMVNINRLTLKPFHELADALRGARPGFGPGPLRRAGTMWPGQPELLLNRKEVRGVKHNMVRRWSGLTSTAGEWLRAVVLVHCPEKVAEYRTADSAAAPRRAPGRSPWHGGVGLGQSPPRLYLRQVSSRPCYRDGWVRDGYYRLAQAAEVRVGKALRSQAQASSCWDRDPGALSLARPRLGAETRTPLVQVQ
jgi:hypothetical protein